MVFPASDHSLALLPRQTEGIRQECLILEIIIDQELRAVVKIFLIGSVVPR